MKLAAARLYDCVGSWRHQTPMQQKRCRLSALVVPNHKIHYDDDHQEDRRIRLWFLDQLDRGLTEEIYIPNVNGRTACCFLAIELAGTMGRTAVSQVQRRTHRRQLKLLKAFRLKVPFRRATGSSTLSRRADALITVSRQRTFIGADPGVIMVGFQGVMDRLRAIDDDKNDDRFRALIWSLTPVAAKAIPDLKARCIISTFWLTQFRSLLLTDHPEQKRRAELVLRTRRCSRGTLRSAE